MELKLIFPYRSSDQQNTEHDKLHLNEMVIPVQVQLKEPFKTDPDSRICDQYRKYIKDGQCLFCGKCFKLKMEGVQHVKRVHKEQIDPKIIEPKLPVVIRFTKKFDNPDPSISKKTLKTNVRNFQTFGPYGPDHKKVRYQCQYCNKMINDKGNLARHESLCSKFGRYIQDGKCLFCCKSYRLRYMYRHIISAHRDLLDTEVLQGSDEESSKCKNCGKKYQKVFQKKYHETICNSK